MSLERRAGFGPPALSHGPYDYDREIDAGLRIRDYWQIIRKHLWLIIGMTLLLPTLVAIYLVRKPDVFEAQARIQVDLENGNALLGQMSKSSSVILSNESNDPAYFNTQLQILTGPGLLRRIVKNLDLEHNPDFGANITGTSTWSHIRSILGWKSSANQKNPGPDAVPVTSSSSPDAQDLAEAERISDYVDTLQTNLVVDPVKETRLTVRETRLIDISYRHTNPHLAAKIVNGIADTFVQQNLDKKTDNYLTTGSYLQKRIAELQGTIRTKEEELINYGRTHQILSLNEKENTVVERLAGLNKQLLDAENERKLAEAAYRASLQPGAADALAQGGASEKGVLSATALSTEAELKLAELKQKRAELLVENTEKWPAVKEIDKQIIEREKQINDTRSRATKVITTNLATRYRQALATEDALRKSYNQQREETLTQNEAAVQYRIIQQEIDTNKTLLEGLLQQTKQNDVVRAGTPNNVRVVDYAIAQKKPVSPKRTLIVGLSFLLALGFGVGLAFLLEYLDDTIRTSEDIENVLHLPSIALIPLVGAPVHRRWLIGAQKNGNSTNGKSKDVLFTDMDKRSPIAEAYRHLRTSILLSTAGRAPRTLLVTSSVPSEGKTTTAVNTAISLAQTGAKVLMIDADMRRPRLHSIFDLSNRAGLSSLLSRDVVYDDIASTIQHEQNSGLFVITAGPLPPNPAELIGSEQMAKLIAEVSAKFTHVVVDSPPVAAFTDGVLIASMVEGVVLVVHSGKNSRKLVLRARKLLQDVGARIIGVVLNKADVRSRTDYYYNSYYSHYHDGPEIPADNELTA
jgi:polysaccharide biosynthesis transport protein